MDNAKRNLESIICYKHNQKLSYVDLGEIPKTGTRILCDVCPNSKQGIQVQQFQNLCFDFTSKIKQANNPLIENVRNVYLTSLQQIHDLLASFNKKVQESLFRASCSSSLYDGIDKLFTSLPQRYHFNDFESIAQAMSESVEKKQNLWEFKAFEINDQKLAEAHHFYNITNKLLQTITNFFTNEGIKDEIQQEIQLLQNTKVKKNLSSKKLLTGHDSYISQLQFNYDSSIICARFKESFNFLAFWKQDQYFQWKAMENLSCFNAGITTFIFSKHENTLITGGSDCENDAQKTSKLKVWKYKDQEWNQVNEQRCSSRISTMKLTIDEKILLVSVGCCIGIYSLINCKLTILNLCKISNEILSDVDYQQDILVTGSGDGMFSVFQVNQNWELQQKTFMRIYSTPKQVIYKDNIIYGLTKDGIVYIIKYAQNRLQLIQTINNNLGKYRTMYFETIQKYLALGDESNNVSLWSFENTEQLICFIQIKQEDYVETICISEKQDLLISSSDKDIMFHYNFI